MLAESEDYKFEIKIICGCGIQKMWACQICVARSLSMPAGYFSLF